jgi:hypothetical protein
VVFTPSPPPIPLRYGRVLSQARAPLQSISLTPPRIPVVCTCYHQSSHPDPSAVLAPSEVLSPLAFSQPRRATDCPTVPNRRSRCALRVSHPLDALLPPRSAGLVSSRYRSWGFPSRLCSLRWPYALSNAASLMDLAEDGMNRHAALQGSSTHRRSPGDDARVNRDTTRMPPWALPPLRFLASSDRQCPQALSLPSRALSDWPSS